MSLLVFLLLARPGGGTGGAEASPPRLRARGAAPEPTCWHRHGATPRAGRGVEKTQGEAQMQLHNEHSDAEKLSGDKQRRRGLGDRADSAARGAQAPHPPTAAAAWLARTALGEWRNSPRTPTSKTATLARGACARPRVARLAPQARSMFLINFGVRITSKKRSPSLCRRPTRRLGCRRRSVPHDG